MLNNAPRIVQNRKEKIDMSNSLKYKFFYFGCGKMYIKYFLYITGAVQNAAILREGNMAKSAE